MILDFEIDELLGTQEEKPQGTSLSSAKKGILHLCGTKFSGKSTILGQVKNRRIIYDVASFYKEHRCISQGKMDWKRFREVIHLLSADVDKFIARSGDSNLLIIESSGIGKSIKSVIDYLILEKGYALHEIYLAPPDSVGELSRRMSSRSDNVGTINDELNYIHVWNREIEKLGIHNRLVSIRGAIGIINNLFTKYGIRETIQYQGNPDDYREFF